VGFSGTGCGARLPRCGTLNSLASGGNELDILTVVRPRAKMSASMYHELLYVCCTFGMIAAWAIRPADSRSRGLTGSDRSDIPTLALRATEAPRGVRVYRAARP
jgi:hypothetical protein